MYYSHNQDFISPVSLPSAELSISDYNKTENIDNLTMVSYGFLNAKKSNYVPLSFSG